MSVGPETSGLLAPSADGESYTLYSPTALPNAGGFLWNRRMMIKATCRGYATAHFMQPEPAKYAHAPNLEARTFMKPEQPYYAHHQGRFFYLKNEDSGALYSVPCEPVRATPQAFGFSVGKRDIAWCVRYADIEVDVRLQLPVDDTVELWQCQVRNLDGRARRIALYAYFPVGYMSWSSRAASTAPTSAASSAAASPRNRRSRTISVTATSRTPPSCCTSSRPMPGMHGRPRPCSTA